MGPLFFITAISFGIALAMDAFSVALANGLDDPCMRKRKMTGIAVIFGLFQGLMPFIGWALGIGFSDYITAFDHWIAFVLLAFIGGKMLLEGINNQESEAEKSGLGLGALIVQGIATSIDALSVGCTISEYGFFMALVSAFIIALVTFGICFSGLIIGKKFGTKIAGKASILGGGILIFIGLEIFVTGVFF